MTVRKHFTCDLCGSSITPTDGIAVVHKANGDIRAEWLGYDPAGHHLCNGCVKGLRGMLAELDAVGREDRL